MLSHVPPANSHANVSFLFLITLQLDSFCVDVIGDNGFGSDSITNSDGGAVAL
jgi:hypothetical protein